MLPAPLTSVDGRGAVFPDSLFRENPEDPPLERLPFLVFATGLPEDDPETRISGKTCLNCRFHLHLAACAFMVNSALKPARIAQSGKFTP
jgi:hypothetical protein